MVFVVRVIVWESGFISGLISYRLVNFIVFMVRVIEFILSVCDVFISIIRIFCSIVFFYLKIIYVFYYKTKIDVDFVVIFCVVFSFFNI